MRDYHGDIFTIGIGGAAGDGVREAGNTIGTLLTELGYEVFISFTYPSLIRGGHNFTRISFSKEKVFSDHTKLDVLIALNKESVALHRDELLENAVVFADEFTPEDIAKLKEKVVSLPMLASSKKLGAPAITRNSVALGALCYLLDLHFPTMQKILHKVFKDKKLEANIKLADIGFEYLEKKNFRHSKHIEPTKSNKELIDGNSAFAKGLEAAGLDFYVSYPMTPATTILHFLANEQATNKNLRVIQPENELSAINMALGMSYAGKRVALGSATGGFELMQEAFSFAGGAELPIVIAVSQRQAPATGLPTYSSQTDLRNVIHAGHGEFPRIVLAPGDSEQAFEAGANALNLAWKYQLPVIVLMDKIVSEHAVTSFNDKHISIEQGKIAEKTGETYGRYEITQDGISPMAFPGTAKTVVKVTSYEHDEKGITADEALPVKVMIDKRFAKSETLKKALVEQETVKVYGDSNAETVIVFWGSTKGPVLEAAKYLDKPVKLLQVIWLEPFDTKKVTEELKNAKKIINIECNHDGQMSALISQKTGIAFTENILKYDSRPFDPVELAEKIKKLV